MRDAARASASPRTTVRMPLTCDVIERCTRDAYARERGDERLASDAFILVNGTPRLLVTTTTTKEEGASAVRVDVVKTLERVNAACERALVECDDGGIGGVEAKLEAVVATSACAAELAVVISRDVRLCREARERGCFPAMARTMMGVMCAALDWGSGKDDVKRAVLDAHARALLAKTADVGGGDRYVVARELACEEYLVALVMNMEATWSRRSQDQWNAELHSQEENDKHEYVEDSLATAYAIVFDAVVFRNDTINDQGDRTARAPATTVMLRAFVGALRFHVRCFKARKAHCHLSDAALKSLVHAHALYRHIALSDEVDRAFDTEEMGDDGRLYLDEFTSVAKKILDSFMKSCTSHMPPVVKQATLSLLLDVLECFTADSNAYRDIGERMCESLVYILRAPDEYFERVWTSKICESADSHLNTFFSFSLRPEMNSFAWDAPVASNPWRARIERWPSPALSLFRILGNLHDVEHNFSPVTRYFVEEGFTKVDEYFIVRRNCKALKRTVFELRDLGKADSLTEEEIEAWDDFVDDFDKEFTRRHPDVDINAMCREFASP